MAGSLMQGQYGDIAEQWRGLARQANSLGIGEADPGREQ